MKAVVVGEASAPAVGEASAPGLDRSGLEGGTASPSLGWAGEQVGKEVWRLA